MVDWKKQYKIPLVVLVPTLLLLIVFAWSIIPDGCGLARRLINSCEARSTIRYISLRQETCLTNKKIDANRDGISDYASNFKELPDEDGILLESDAVNTQALDHTFPPSIILLDSYLFRLYASPNGQSWCCIAWPMETGKTGQAIMMVADHNVFGKYDNTDGVFSGLDYPPKFEDFYGAPFINDTIGKGHLILSPKSTTEH